VQSPGQIELGALVQEHLGTTAARKGGREEKSARHRRTSADRRLLAMSILFILQIVSKIAP